MLLKGTYGLAVISPRNPDVIVGARSGQSAGRWGSAMVRVSWPAIRPP